MVRDIPLLLLLLAHQAYVALRCADNQPAPLHLSCRRNRYKFYKGEWVWLALLVQLLLGLWLVGICLNNPPGDVAVWQADWLAYILMALWGLNTGTGVCCTMMYMVRLYQQAWAQLAACAVPSDCGLLFCSRSPRYMNPSKELPAPWASA